MSSESMSFVFTIGPLKTISPQHCKPTDYISAQGYHTSGKIQGDFIFFKVRESSGNLANCQGNLELSINVRELSGNFENTRFKSNYEMTCLHSICILGQS